MRFVVSTLTLLSALAAASPAFATFGRPGETPKTSETGPLDLGPSPHLTPRQVVEVQLGGLAAHSEWGQNLGLELSFRFASPENRAVTGPFLRFASMVKRGYEALLDHRDANIGPLELHAGAAYVPVIITDRGGAQHGFVWVLGRQSEGAFANCWMTDAVLRAPLEAIRPKAKGQERI